MIVSRARGLREGRRGGVEGGGGRAGALLVAPRTGPLLPLGGRGEHGALGGGRPPGRAGAGRRARPRTAGGRGTGGGRGDGSVRHVGGGVEQRAEGRGRGRGRRRGVLHHIVQVVVLKHPHLPTSFCNKAASFPSTLTCQLALLPPTCQLSTDLYLRQLFGRSAVAALLTSPRKAPRHKGVPSQNPLPKQGKSKPPPIL